MFSVRRSPRHGSAHLIAWPQDPFALVVQLKHVLHRAEADPFVEGNDRQQATIDQLREHDVPVTTPWTSRERCPIRSRISG
jgi:hypothetical protein